MAIVTTRGIDPSTVHSTPRAVTRALLDHLRQQPFTASLLQRGAVWDCACGSMAIITELLAADPPARAVVSSDIILRPGATIPKPLDFTWTTPPAELTHRPRFIITNPPFSLSTQFMDTALRWIDGVPGAALALFLPIGALGGQKRARQVYSNAAPSQILILSERVDIFPDGYVPAPGKHRGGVIEYGWFLWYNDMVEGRLLTYAQQADYGVNPFVWVMPGTLDQLDPEAAHQKAERSKRNKQAAAAASRAKRKRATTAPAPPALSDDQTGSTDMQEADHG